MERKILFSSIIVVILFGAKNVKNQEEPVCTSRFDYDHKMLQKMIMMEMEQRNAKSIFKEMEAKLSKETEESNRYRSMLENLDERIKNIESAHSSSRTGNTYVRWGRTQCPGNGTELVYKGYAAGSFYNNQGASSNYLCLPEEPLWNIYEDAEQVSGTVWGAEYELYGRNMDNFFEKKCISMMFHAVYAKPSAQVFCLSLVETNAMMAGR